MNNIFSFVQFKFNVLYKKNINFCYIIVVNFDYFIEVYIGVYGLNLKDLNNFFLVEKLDSLYLLEYY